MGYLNEAGPLIWLVLVAGIVALVMAALYAANRQRRQASAALAATAGTVIVALIATVTGFQRAVGPLGQVAAEERWIYLIGLQESLNNVVVALVLAFLVTVLLAIGTWRRDPRAAH